MSELLVVGASARAVDGLLGRLNVSGSSRRTLKRKQIQQVQEPTVFGTPIRTIDLPKIGGGVVRWTGAAHPAAMLNHMAKTKAFSDILKDRMSKCKPTFRQPWRLIYFADEATSGNLLRRDPTKKAWCIYFTWVEMGTALMSMDISWIYGGIIHINKVKEVDGGFGTVFKHHMDYFFGQQCDLRNGITIHTADSEVLMLFSTLGMVLADELGTREIWGLKGSGSWRPCALCANVVNARFGFEEHVTRDIVLHTETDPRKLKLHTDESVFAIIDKLRKASTSRCAELEKIHGFHHQRHGVLQCLQLRSVVKPSCISYDFMHCFLTNGV